MPPCWLGVPGWRGPDAVVPRPGLALGRRADRRARLQLWGVDGLAHPAHRPGAEPRLPADRHGVPRPRAGAQLGRSTASPPASSPPASCWGAIRWRCSASICWSGFAIWRLLSARRAARPRCAQACCRSAAGGVCAALIIAVPVMLTALLAAGIQPPLDRLHRRRARLAASGAAADARRCPTCSAPRAAWRTTGARRASPGPIRASSSPRTWASSTSARIPLLLLLIGRRARPAVGAARSASSPAPPASRSLYALGWYTPVFRVLYALLPGVSLYRRPADATFLIGALAAILAGYGAHRLFERAARADRPRSTAIVAAATLGLAFLLAIAPGAVARPRAALSLPLAAALALVCRRGRRAGLGDAAHRDQPAAGRGRARRRHHRRSRLQQRPLAPPPPSRRRCTTCSSPTPATPPSPS